MAAVASAMPEQVVGRDGTAAALARLFPDEDPHFIADMVERSGVEQRHVALPLEQVFSSATFTERNALYRTAARDLARRACESALAKARVDPRAIDVIVDVSCTGIMIPALDVELAPLLGLRSDVLRIPITESGCAAGALALALCGRLAEQGSTCLVVAVELCSMTSRREDMSRTNLVASVLFGDGAAAAVIVPDRAQNDAAGPRFVAAGSHLFPETRDLMGFDVGTHGLKIVLQRELPVMLTRHLRGAVLDFLARHERTVDDIGLHLVHPGGRRILDSYVDMFGLPADALAHSHESLRRYGNLSSASILTVFELALDARARPAPGLEGLVVGIGPGLSMEISLWSWDA